MDKNNDFDLDEILNEGPEKKTRKPMSQEHKDKISLTQRKKVELGTFICGMKKYDNAALIEQSMDILQWFIDNPGECMISKYYMSDTSDPKIPYGTYRKAISYRSPESLEIREILKEIIKERIVDLSLRKQFDSKMSMFLLTNHYGMTNSVEQNVNVTNKEIIFDFGGNDIQEATVIEEEKDETTD